jgi:hypothetical protein
VYATNSHTILTPDSTPQTKGIARYSLCNVSAVAPLAIGSMVLTSYGLITSPRILCKLSQGNHYDEFCSALASIFNALSLSTFAMKDTTEITWKWTKRIRRIFFKKMQHLRTLILVSPSRATVCSNSVLVG